MLKRAMNACEIFILILTIILNIYIVNTQFTTNTILFTLASIISILLIQFLYGIVFFRFEYIINKYVFILLLFIYGFCLLIIKNDNILINILNVFSIIYSLYLSSKFTSVLKGNHSSLFLVIISLIIYPYLYISYGNESLLSILFIPLSFLYIYQFYLAEKSIDKINKIVSIIFSLIIIAINIISLPFDIQSNNVLFNFLINIFLIVCLSGMFNKFSVNFNKVKYLTLLFIILYLIINNFLFYFLLIPILLLSYTLSLDEKWQIINVSKYFVSKSERKVSVVIPNYNYAEYIEKRIDSVLNQTYPIYELIILDDKSTDNSEKIIKNKLKNIKEKYQSVKIKYIPNISNSGSVFKQWAKAFEESKGDYVWIAEADDLCSKYFLNSVIKGFKDEDVIISYTESKAIDENGNKIKKDFRNWADVFHDGRWNSSFITDGKKFIAKYLFVNDPIINVSAVVFKKDDKIPFNKYLKEAAKYKLSGDWYFYSKVLLHGKLAYSSDSLNFHRIHSKSVTNTTKENESHEEKLRIQRSILSDIEVSKKALNKTKIIIN